MDEPGHRETAPVEPLTHRPAKPLRDANQPPTLQRVRLVRCPLDDLPDFPLPPGFGLRTYQPGDGDEWAGIVAAADLHHRMTATDHRRAFGEDERALALRQLFLTAPSGVAIGTASAWVGSEDMGADWGRVHWLAILPRWQGQGLAKPLLSATLRRLRDLGHPRAYLITETVRHPAIRLYLKFGFVPDVRTDADLAAWRGLQHEGLPVPLPASRGT